MVRFIIVRHGLTTYNKMGRYQGQFDSPLDEIGIRQAEATADFIARTYHVDAICSSDLSRARNTAAPLAKRLGLSVETFPALREVQIGEWTNRIIADVVKEEPERVAMCRSDPGHFRYPGGESFQEVYDRAASCLAEIAKRHDGETVVVVSHGGTIRSLICVWSGTPIEELRTIKSLKNTSITIAEYENGSAHLLQIGDNSHLPEELQSVQT